ncbi:hypothetical protein H5410_016858 [Solanum commersonii]|uniref:Uncharacterized protein n=1 Tax=Solanum commersonii TaxID=4109 RepID=A0A9J5ZYG3_SOLCO|nr:hypothetical protein H5410_016858 [Solanum commersonii]
MWVFNRSKGASGFAYSSTAEEVTDEIDGSGLTAIVTGAYSISFSLLFSVQNYLIPVAGGLTVRDGNGAGRE